MAGMNSQGYEGKTWYGITDEDNGSVDIVTAEGVGVNVYINKLTISVFKSAQGGGGIFELRYSDGETIHKIDTDVAKDVPFDFGEAGLDAGTNRVLQGVVYGAETNQASVSVVCSGYKKVG